MLLNEYTNRWSRLMRIMRDPQIRKVSSNIFFRLQFIQYDRERNRRRHGEGSSPASLLIRRIDKKMRNKLTLIQRKGDKEFKYKINDLSLKVFLIFLNFDRRRER